MNVVNPNINLNPNNVNNNDIEESLDELNLAFKNYRNKFTEIKTLIEKNSSKINDISKNLDIYKSCRH